MPTQLQKSVGEIKMSHHEEIGKSANKKILKLSPISKQSLNFTPIKKSY
jgi:hypothetical protein